MKSLKIVLVLPLVLFFLLCSSCQERLSKKELLEKTIQAQIDSIDGTVAVAFYSLSQPKDSLLINVDERFHAASTMKVPVMMEVFRQAHEGLLSLDERLPILNSFKSIVDGSEFALEEADDSDLTLYKRIGETESIRELNRLMKIGRAHL